MAVSEISPMTPTCNSPVSPYSPRSKSPRKQVYSRNSNNAVTKVYVGKTTSALYGCRDESPGLRNNRQAQEDELFACDTLDDNGLARKHSG